MSKFGGENLYFWGSLYFIMEDANSFLNLFSFFLFCPHYACSGTGTGLFSRSASFSRTHKHIPMLLSLSYALRLPDHHESSLV